MTVSTEHTRGDLELPTIIGGDLPGLAVLEQWSQANDYATRLVAQWIFTDLVPVHHWPLPPGQTLRTMPNPRVYGENETDESYRRRCEIAAASAAGTVLRGISVGLPPNVALEQMFSIRGTIGMKTRAKVALARSRGIKVWDVKLDPEEVTCAGIDRLTGETVTISLTMSDARRAGWTSNDAYSKTPVDMLWSRTMSRVLDRIAGDVLFGLASIEDVDPEPEPAPAAATVTVEELVARTGTSTVAAPVNVKVGTPEEIVEALDRAAGKLAPVVDEPADRTVPHADPAPLDERAWRLVNDAFVKLGVTGPGQKAKRLAIVEHVIGRPIASATELSAVEGDLLLETLNGMDRPTVAALLADKLADRGPAGGDEGPAAPEAAPAPAPGPQAAEGWPADVDPSDADLEPTDDELAPYGETR